MLPHDPLPTAADPAVRPFTLRALEDEFARFQRWASGFRSHSAATLAWRRDSLRSFSAFLVARGVVAIDEATAPRLLEEWVIALRARQLSPFSVRCYWNGLASFFRYLERELGFRNPFVTLPRPALPDAEPKARTPEECARILAGAWNAPWRTPYERHRALAMVAVALYAGLRRGEILHLRTADVDLAQRSIRVHRGKGRGGGKDRTSFIAPELATILAAFVEERARRRLDTVEFFASQQGARGVSLATFRRTVRRVRAVSGVPFTVHSLRHSFVTGLLRARVPLHVASALAGHTDIRTTQRYLRAFDEDKRAGIDQLSFGLPPQT